MIQKRKKTTQKAANYFEWHSEEKIPKSLPVLALRNNVMFPFVISPVALTREQSQAVLDEHAEGAIIGIFSQKDPKQDEVKNGALYAIGTAAEILRVEEDENHSPVIWVRGITRIAATKFNKFKPYIIAQVKELITIPASPTDRTAFKVELQKVVRETLKYMPDLPAKVTEMLDTISDAEVLCDIVSSNLFIEVNEKQEILETLDLKERLKKVYKAALKQLEIAKISARISRDAQKELDKNQREYYLRTQLRAIQNELGEGEESDIGDLTKQIQDKKLPPEIQEVAIKELSRLSRMRDISPEYTMSRTYLEWLLEMPWTESTEDNLDLTTVRAILERDHYDLERVKERIVEYLAVRKLKNDMRGPILCLVGPPGVGKTSLGRSVAEAMGRRFIRMSFGGVHDEAEIRGHRRTYIGALPGRIIQGIKKAGTNNPVFMLDEVDKLGRDYRGDPSAALLEVLDPEQNHSFQDHYLNVSFDLSKVFFIATANMLDTIPPALRDRVEVIELPGYTLEEKVQIAKRHLLPKQIREHGLTENHLEIGEKTVATIIQNYTREAGVRNIERELATLCRKTAVNVAEKNGKDSGLNSVDEASLDELLGPPKFLDELKVRVTRAGISTGLAWTPNGGEIIFIEATDMPGKMEITLTGQLGEVMRESAHAAIAYVRSQATTLGLSPNFLENKSVHIHIPAAGIPKDGPSAGLAILMALVSLFSSVKVRDDIAMTGEISLRGLVLPVGGIKEKLLAAHRNDIRTVIIPERNQKDLREIPKNTLDQMQIIPVRWVSEALEVGLVKKLSPLPRLFADDTVQPHEFNRS